eukprot:scaffold5546_cov247-Pinguiococcus_pyrenoidosus.AAC.1
MPIARTIEVTSLEVRRELRNGGDERENRHGERSLRCVLQWGKERTKAKNERRLKMDSRV